MMPKPSGGSDRGEDPGGSGSPGGSGDPGDPGGSGGPGGTGGPGGSGGSGGTGGPGGQPGRGEPPPSGETRIPREPRRASEPRLPSEPRGSTKRGVPTNVGGPEVRRRKPTVAGGTTRRSPAGGEGVVRGHRIGDAAPGAPGLRPPASRKRGAGPGRTYVPEPTGAGDRAGRDRGVAAPAEGGASADDPEGTEGQARQAKAPWHFKFIVVGSVIYLGWRLYQGISWLAHHL